MEVAYSLSIGSLPTSVTLNDLCGVIAIFLRSYSPNSIALETDYITVVEARPIMSVEYIVFHFWPKLTHLVARSLCDS